MTTVELAPTSATESPLMAGVLVPPLSLMSMPVTGDPAVIVTLSGLPIPAEKLASLAATSAAVPLAVALPVNVILGAASSMVPTSPLPALVVSVPPMVIDLLPPVRAKPVAPPLEVRNAAGSVSSVVSTSPPVLKLPVGPTRMPLGLLSQTTMLLWPVTAPLIVEVLPEPSTMTRFSTAYWLVALAVR